MQEIENLRKRKPKDFWKYFKTKSKPTEDNISIEAFREYFSNLSDGMFDCHNEEAELFCSSNDFDKENVSFPELDQPITIDEIQNAIKITSDVNNYRGITLVSCLSKLFTTVLNKRIELFCDNNNIISDAQFGFRKGRSTVDAIYALMSIVQKYLNENKRLYIVYVDMMKCFDSIYRNALWLKMYRCGIGGKLLRILKDMYQKVKSCVRSCSTYSDYFNYAVGLRQGEVMSPLLFSLFVEDLELYLQNDIHSGLHLDDIVLILLLFADDMAIIGKTPDELQSHLDHLLVYCNTWGLRVNTTKTKIMVFRKFNTDKCGVMHLGNNNPHNSYQMRDNEGSYRVLNETEVEKDLGLYIDNKLTFQHVNQAVNKANKVLGLIRRTFASRDTAIIKRLYMTMVRPILEYGNAPRIQQFVGDVDKLERVQRRTTKLCKDIKDLPYEGRLKKMKLPSLHYRQERGDMIQVYKILTGKDRINQEKLLPRSQLTRTRGHRMKLVKQRGRLNIRKFSFGLRVVNNWNALPDSVVSSKDINKYCIRNLN